MLFATLSSDGEKRIAAVVNETYIDLNVACRLYFEGQGKYRAKQLAAAYIPPNMVEFLQSGDEGMELAKQSVEFAVNNEFLV